MTSSSLRLVVSPSEGAVAPAIELPVSEGSVLHLHLHLGTPAAAPAPVPAVMSAPRSRAWFRWLAFGAFAAVLVVVSYDVGTFATHRVVYQPISAADGEVPSAIPGVPPALKGALATPPVVTPPPSAPALGSAFGLHP